MISKIYINPNTVFVKEKKILDFKNELQYIYITEAKVLSIQISFKQI